MAAAKLGTNVPRNQRPHSLAFPGLYPFPINFTTATAALALLRRVRLHGTILLLKPALLLCLHFFLGPVTVCLVWADPFWHPNSVPSQCGPPDCGTCVASVTEDIDIVAGRVVLHIGLNLFSFREGRVVPTAMSCFVLEQDLPWIVTVNFRI